LTNFVHFGHFGHELVIFGIFGQLRPKFSFFEGPRPFGELLQVMESKKKLIPPPPEAEKNLQVLLGNMG
jgi:hypothetical protein